MHLLSPLLVLSLAFQSSSSKVASFGRRRLAEHFHIVSRQDASLCIMAPSFAGESLELQPSEYRNPPAEQLWRFDGSQIVSRLGNGREYCMMVNNGHTVFDGVRIRLGFCQTSGLTDFAPKGDSIYVQGQQLCLTSTGIPAVPGSHIEARRCEPSQLRFRWSRSVDQTSGGQTEGQTEGQTGGQQIIEMRLAGVYDMYYTFESGSELCAQPKDGRARDGNEIVLKECDYDHAWYVYQDEKSGLVLFQSVIDTRYCLQAGLGGALVDGTKMRLALCNYNLQIFKWDYLEAPIIPKDNRRLCMEPQGSDPGAGALLILKSCNVRSDEWSGDLKDVTP